jgi:ubiquinone/menaquinone biosynthesis C-methylase UbiE
MDENTGQTSYVIHSDEEPRRLDRQAAIYGTEDDLRHVGLGLADSVLDAGCGSGSAARLFASSRTAATVVGVDRNGAYVDYASREAARQGIGNVTFRVADVLALPFDDAAFDIVWSKHLLQWVRERDRALKQFVRVTRPGGRVVCANFDGFCLQQYPVDIQVQHDLEAWFSAAERELGFDNFIGRKLPSMFKAAGLTDIRVNIIPDKAFCGFGGDPERAWNWEVQWRSALPFSVKVFGGEERAETATTRILKRLNDPDVFFYTTLFYVEGRVPI